MAVAILRTSDGWGSEPWLILEGDSQCASTHPELLAERILERTTGARTPERSIHVDFLENGPNQIAEIRLQQGVRVLGTKRLTAPNCAELVDGVVAVSALALSIQSEEPEDPSSRAAQATQTDGARQGGAPGRPPPTGSLRRSSKSASRSAPASSLDQGPTGDLLKSRARRWRALAAAGVDMGTLDIPTPVVGAGATAVLGNAELRGLGWYGWPSFREEDTSSLESTRYDFAAATLDYCHGLDQGRWLALCGGLEGRLTRLKHVEQRPGLPRKDETSIDASLAAVVGTAFVYRAIDWEPQLALSLHVPTVSTASDAQNLTNLAFRALLGAVYHF